MEVRVNEEEDEDGLDDGEGGKRQPGVRSALSYLKKVWMGAIKRSGLNMTNFFKIINRPNTTALFKSHLFLEN